MTAEEMRDKYGGHWGVHPDHDIDTWRHEVANDETRLGYWEWCEAREDNGEE